MESLSPKIRQPLNEAEREAIRNQLNRMLANPLFRNSKRCPAFLRFVVEHTLEGRCADLKERTLGVEVFGRDPDYDTNADPVVRATAGEIRKRIAQYYHDHQHEAEIRIDLLPGSYVPGFEFQAVRPATVEPLAQRKGPHHWLQYGAIIAAAAGLLAAFYWLKPQTRASALSRFWEPVLDSPNTAVLCVGQRSFLGSAPEPRQQPNPDMAQIAAAAGSPDAPPTLFKLYYMGSQNIALPDAKTLARVAGLLQAHGKNYRILGESSTSFADLRDGPVVLVGGFNNDWTIRLTGQMRFSFEREGDTFRIVDRQKPSDRSRAIDYKTPYLSVTDDYALISRVLDPTTERMVVTAGGLTGYGTVAAGEFLINPVYMDAALKQAPAHWESRNMQFLIATKVIRGISGPPRIVDRNFW